MSLFRIFKLKVDTVLCQFINIGEEYSDQVMTKCEKQKKDKNRTKYNDDIVDGTPTSHIIEQSSFTHNMWN